MTVSLKRQRIVRNVGASQRASKYLNDPENPAGSSQIPELNRSIYTIPFLSERN